MGYELNGKPVDVPAQDTSPFASYSDEELRRYLFTMPSDRNAVNSAVFRFMNPKDGR